MSKFDGLLILFGVLVLFVALSKKDSKCEACYESSMAGFSREVEIVETYLEPAPTRTPANEDHSYYEGKTDTIDVNAFYFNAGI